MVRAARWANQVGQMHYWVSVHSGGTEHAMHDHPEHSFAGVYVQATL